MVHIVLSFRANLLHGSLETCRANWFLRCFFISSNGTNKQEMREGGHWWGWMEENGRRRGESGGDNSCIRECCMDSHYSLKPKSERFHSKWKLLYVGSNNSPCDRALWSHGHSFCHVCLCITITMFTCIQHRFLFYDKFWLFVLCLYLYAVDPKLIWLYALVMDCFYMWVDVDV